MLEQELQDKVRILAQQQDLVRTGQEHKQQIEAELREKEAVVARREAAVRNVTEEWDHPEAAGADSAAASQGEAQEPDHGRAGEGAGLKGRGAGRCEGTAEEEFGGAGGGRGGGEGGQGEARGQGEEELDKMIKTNENDFWRWQRKLLKYNFKKHKHILSKR